MKTPNRVFQNGCIPYLNAHRQRFVRDIGSLFILIGWGEVSRSVGGRLFIKVF